MAQGLLLGSPVDCEGPLRSFAKNVVMMIVVVVIHEIFIRTGQFRKLGNDGTLLTFYTVLVLFTRAGIQKM
jgi:hypothetical protein